MLKLILGGLDNNVKYMLSLLSAGGLKIKENA